MNLFAGDGQISIPDTSQHCPGGTGSAAETSAGDYFTLHGKTPDFCPRVAFNYRLMVRYYSGIIGVGPINAVHLHPAVLRPMSGLMIVTVADHEVK